MLLSSATSIVTSSCHPSALSDVQSLDVTVSGLDANLTAVLLLTTGAAGLPPPPDGTTTIGISTISSATSSFLGP